MPIFTTLHGQKLNHREGACSSGALW